MAVATDKYGNPVPGVSVTFAAPTSGASAALSSSTVTTGANGQASVTATADATLGSYTVTASATGVSSAGLSLSNITVAEAMGRPCAAILSANSDTTDNVVTIQLAAGTYALSLGQLETAPRRPRCTSSAPGRPVPTPASSMPGRSRVFQVDPT